MSFNRGQASIELILLLVVVLLLVQTIILPSKDVAEKSAEDVSSMAIVRSQAQKLANAIELVDSSASGAKQTIHLMIPQHSKIGCDSLIPQLYYQTWPNATIGIPERCKNDTDNLDNVCTGYVKLSLSSGVGFDCGIMDSSQNTGSIIDRSDSNSAVFVSVEVSKSETQVSLSVE